MDYNSGRILLKDGECEKRYSPASTFKIAIALMGYDSGILKDKNTPAWPFQEGYTVNKDDDKQTTDPVLWEKNSVVWYSQKITKMLGMEKFQHYTDQFNYGNKDLSGDYGKNNGLTRSWLISSLKISPVEQAAFIKNFLSHNLGVSTKSYEMTEEILPKFQAEDGWVLKGKTGSGEFFDEKAVKQSQGWFVGWAEKGNRKIIFVKLLFEKQTTDTPTSWKARDWLVSEFPELIR